MLTGPNGSGKTNLLEAVSLLVPGRGLRQARLVDLQRQAADAAGGWGVAARVQRGPDVSEIGTGAPPDGAANRRVFRLDGAAPRSQADVAAVLSAVWLTPQMDRFVPGKRVRPPAVPGPAGLGAGTRPCAGGVCV